MFMEREKIHVLSSCQKVKSVRRAWQFKRNYAIAQTCFVTMMDKQYDDDHMDADPTGGIENAIRLL